MMNVKLSSSVAAASALAMLVACAGGTDGSSRFAAPTGPALDVVAAQTGTVCKSGPVGTYNFDLVFGGTANTNDVQSSSPLALTVTDAATPACATVFTRTEYAGGQIDPAASIQVTEQAAPGTDLTGIVASGGAAPSSTNVPGRTATIYVNAFHSATVTFTNTAVATGCTYTKGWYRNNGSSTVIAVDGRTVSDEQAIFGATPGKPNGVTWGADNNNLNLYQQLLAALNNLGGDPLAGPASVDAAIAAALTATGGSGKSITVAAGTDVSGLISVLSAFNEGSLTGWPHCAD
jgi:hypothetical protein